jgi:hypothetical protein
MRKLLIIGLLLCSCGHQIHKGKVVKKRYEPARHYQYTTYTIVGKVMIPQFHVGYDDPDWVVTVQGKSEGEWVVEEFYISQSRYNCMAVGDLFNDSIPCSRKDLRP